MSVQSHWTAPPPQEKDPLGGIVTTPYPWPKPNS